MTAGTVAVEQVDRVSMVSYEAMSPVPLSIDFGIAIQAGKHDHDPRVQAFARHRLAAASAQPGVVQPTDAQIDAAARALYKDYEETTDEHVQAVWGWSECTEEEVRHHWSTTVREMRDWAQKALTAALAVAPLSTRQGEAVREAAAKVADDGARLAVLRGIEVGDEPKGESTAAILRAVAKDIRAMPLPTIASEDRGEVERLRAALSEAAYALECRVQMAFHHRTFPAEASEYDAAMLPVHRARAALSPNAITDDGARGWQPIETVERENGLRLILAWDDCPTLPYHWEVGRWSRTLGWVNTYGKPFGTGEPTHWMVPAAPHANVEKEAGNGR